MTKIRTAVIGVGAFGRNHVRAISQSDQAELTAVVDSDPGKAAAIAAEYGSRGYGRMEDLFGLVEAAIVATPTILHEETAAGLMKAGIDVLVEKPIAHSAEAGERMTRLAEECGRILQVGHLERFNPAITALQKALTIPLFFEVHRLSMFSPRSLDVDVVLDLMIHDLDIVLSFTGEMPEEIRAAGISVLSKKVDIANVRLAFPSGCIANLTASRVSTEKVRKLRLFQPGQYVSLDYERQDAVGISVNAAAGQSGIGFEPLAVEHGEPLALELRSFFDCVRTRTRPVVDGREATRALQVAEAIVAKIKEHGNLVAQTVGNLRPS